MSGQFYADLIVLIHFCFILFVIFGGFLALKWRKLILLHLPSAVWGSLIEFTGWICPLTPFENFLRKSSSGKEYSGSFVEHYIIPLIYPDGLTREIQIGLGMIVLVLNITAYILLYLKWSREQDDE